MSLESAKSFMERMKNDEDFKNKVVECKDSEVRMKYVQEAGFNFTAEDMELAGAELSEEDIMAIAGGEKICGILPPYFIIEG